jgi:hypothetical protein
MNIHADRPETFFITGTGRCGTMLLARLLNESRSAACDHEKYFRHKSMIDHYECKDMSGFEDDIFNSFEPQRIRLRNEGKRLGVSSGHLYFAIPRLWEIYESRARFILLVRRPDEFVRSAMARGFFDPSHPNYCNQITPAPDEPIASRWMDISVIERNLWYWTMVNRFVLDAFGKIPRGFWRIIRIEELNSAAVLDVCGFLGITDIKHKTIADMLGRRINSSPGLPGAHDPNPYSLPISIPPLAEWNEDQKDLLNGYTSDLVRRLYPEAGPPPGLRVN